MEPDSAQPLVVAITSRALFSMEDSHGLFEREGVEAFRAHQHAHEDQPLSPGVAFPLVRKLLALNAIAPPGAPHVEVILLSRNSTDTGLRIFNSIQHHGLDIVRATFTSGAPPSATAPLRIRTSARSARTCSCPRMPKTCATHWLRASRPPRCCPPRRRNNATTNCASPSTATR
jgi:hypothetical protein